MLNATVLPRKRTYVYSVFSFCFAKGLAKYKFGVSDKCFLVLFHTPLFIFVKPLALLISMHFTCFVCFVINRPLHHVLIKGAIGHEVKRSS
jgi:hypothetical protein